MLSSDLVLREQRSFSSSIAIMLPHSSTCSSSATVQKPVTVCRDSPTHDHCVPISPDHSSFSLSPLSSPVSDSFSFDNSSVDKHTSNKRPFSQRVFTLPPLSDIERFKSENVSFNNAPLCRLHEAPEDTETLKDIRIPSLRDLDETLTLSEEHMYKRSRHLSSQTFRFVHCAPRTPGILDIPLIPEVEQYTSPEAEQAPVQTSEPKATVGSMTSCQRVIKVEKTPGETNNTCPYCSRSFKRKHDLQRHIRLHTGERPYKCSMCQRSFSRTDALRRHYSLEHKC